MAVKIQQNSSENKPQKNSKRQKSVLTYEISMMPDQEAVVLLEATGNFYTQGLRNCLNLLLSLHGAAKPYWQDYSIFSQTSASRAEKKRDKDKRDQSTAYPVAVHLFHSWFALELKSETVNNHCRIAAEKLRPQYLSYCREAKVEPDDGIMEMLQNGRVRDDCIWVDRRRAYLELRKRSGNAAALDKFVDALVALEDYPVSEKDDESAISTASRGVLSMAWGEDAEDKTNWEHMAKIAEAILDYEPRPNATRGQICNSILAVLDCADQHPKIRAEIEDNKKSKTLKRALLGSDSKSQNGDPKSKSGRDDFIYTFVENVISGERRADQPLDEKDRKNFFKKIQESHRSYRAKARFVSNMNPEILDFLMGEVEKGLGTVYNDGQCRKINEFAAMFAGAWSKLSAHKKQTLNQYDRRLALVEKMQDADQAFGELPKSFHSAITKYRAACLDQARKNTLVNPPDHYWFNRRQINGLSELLSEWKTNANLNQAVDQLQEEERFGGDVNLVKALIPFAEEIRTEDKDWRDTFAACLRTLVRKDEVEESLYLLRTPRLTYVPHEGWYFPHHGPNSMPFAEYRCVENPSEQAFLASEVNGLKRKKWRGKDLNYLPKFHVEFNLFDGQEFRRKTIPCFGRRLYVEVLQEQGGKPGPRNHSLISMLLRKQSGGKEEPVVQPERINLSFMPFTRKRGENTRYYAKATATLGLGKDFQPLSRKDLADMERLPVVALDLGQRQAAYQSLVVVSHIQTNECVMPARPAKGKRAKAKIHLSMPCSGRIDPERKDPITGEVAHLFSESSRKVRAEEMALLEDMRAEVKRRFEKREAEEKAKNPDKPQRKKREFEDPKTLLEVQGDLAHTLNRLVRFVKTEKDIRVVEKYYRKVMEVFFGPTFQWYKTLAEKVRHIQSKENEVNHKAGGLSFRRIDNLLTLSDAIRSFRKRCDGVKELNPKAEGVHGLREQFDRVFKKLDNIRTERVRLTLNRALQFAIEHGAKMIVAENLQNLVQSRFRQRGQNRRIQAWCCRRFGKLLEEKARLLGIHVRFVPAAYSSQLDWTEEATGMQVPVTWRRFRRPVKKDGKPMEADYIAKLLNYGLHPEKAKDNDKPDCLEVLLKKFCVQQAISENGKAVWKRLCHLRETGKPVWCFGGEQYIPVRGGEFFVRTSFYGADVDLTKTTPDKRAMVDSDEAASATLAVRGIMYLHDLKATKKKVEEEEAA